jgi:hypothetical protein
LVKRPGYPGLAVAAICPFYVILADIEAISLNEEAATLMTIGILHLVSQDIAQINIVQAHLMCHPHCPF